MVRQSKKDPRSLGQIVAQSGLIDVEEFDTIRTGLEEDALFELFTIRSGTFAFFTEKFPEPGLEVAFEECVEFDASQVLLEVARRSDEWKVILETLGDLGEVFRINGVSDSFIPADLQPDK